MKTYNYEYERAVLSSPEFLNKGYIVKSSNEYSVTLIKQIKDKIEEVIIYASYILDL